MPSDAPQQERLEKVSNTLEGLVEQFITDGIQEWSIATTAAIEAVPLPQEEDSMVYWFIALAGNMMWAGTVFMRPLANGLPSPAQKALSVIGAGFGSDTARQVKNLLSSTPSPDHAKEFFGQIAALRADQIEKRLVSNTADWVRDDFYDWALRYAREQWWKRNYYGGMKMTSETEKQRDQWAYEHIANLNAIDKNAYRHYVYKEFVFPGFTIERLEGNSMREEILVKMKKAVSDSFQEYKLQYDQWQWRVNRALDAESRKRLAPGQPAPLAMELRLPFEPDLHFAGLSLPPGEHSMTTGQLVRLWKYKRH